VWQEIQNLKRTAVNQPGHAGAKLYSVIANIQNYLYKRLDSMGAPGAYHWKTTMDTKERAFNLYKDCFERGMMVVKSRECIDEMKNVIRDEGSIGAPGRGKPRAGVWGRALRAGTRAGRGGVDTARARGQRLACSGRPAAGGLLHSRARTLPAPRAVQRLPPDPIQPPNQSSVNIAVP
jgi:hypothetical protein